MIKYGRRWIVITNRSSDEQHRASLYLMQTHTDDQHILWATVVVRRLNSAGYGLYFVKQEMIMRDIGLVVIVVDWDCIYSCRCMVVWVVIICMNIHIKFITLCMLSIVYHVMLIICYWATKKRENWGHVMHVWWTTLCFWDYLSSKWRYGQCLSQ